MASGNNDHETQQRSPGISEPVILGGPAFTLRAGPAWGTRRAHPARRAARAGPAARPGAFQKHRGGKVFSVGDSDAPGALAVSA